MNKGTSKTEKKQASREMKTRCGRFLHPLLAELQERLERRLVKTVLEMMLALVVLQGRKPWYLITTEPVYNAEQAWQIVFAYAKRWHIEMSLRFTKSELAFESPRLQSWESSLKFLLIASLAFAFLLSLLAQTDFLFAFLFRYCHRTGKWSRETSAPLYRLRLALSHLWLDFRPHSLPSLSSG
jgi:hypothetical protein